MSKIKIAAVSYLNTKPFLFGIEQSEIANQCEVQREIPSECFRKLANGEVDLALVPIGGLHRLQEYHIVSDYCIACEGEVETVCLFSDVPLEKIQSVLLDFHSLTSVLLTRALFKHHWKQNPQFLETGPDFEREISGTTAGLIIGDRAIEAKARYRYCFDLGEAWFQWTALPMVFALWVSLRKLEANFEKSFNRALSSGLEKMEDVVNNNPQFKIPGFDPLAYLKDSIQFKIDPEKQEACKFYLQTTREFLELELMPT